MFPLESKQPGAMLLFHLDLEVVVVVWEAILRRNHVVGLILPYIKFVHQNQIENNEFQENIIILFYIYIRRILNIHWPEVI
jgi:hypothetical protein